MGEITLNWNKLKYSPLVFMNWVKRANAFRNSFLEHIFIFSTNVWSHWKWSVGWMNEWMNGQTRYRRTCPFVIANRRTLVTRLTGIPRRWGPERQIQNKNFVEESMPYIFVTDLIRLRDIFERIQPFSFTVGVVTPIEDSLPPPLFFFILYYEKSMPHSTW